MARLIRKRCSPREVLLASSGSSKTLQQFKQESDINYLIDRQKRTGSFYDALSVVGRERRVPMFEDFSSVPDIGQAYRTVSKVSEDFSRLPSSIRLFFSNSPSAMYAWLMNPENKDKAVEMGLLPKPVSAPAPTEPKKEEASKE